MSIDTHDISQLFGSRLTLVHQSAFEQLQFGSDGVVVATVGRKQGPICAPLWHWSLTNDGRLIAYDKKRLLGLLWPVRNCIYLEWSSIRIGDNTVTVETPSGARVYERQTLSIA